MQPCILLSYYHLIISASYHAYYASKSPFSLTCTPSSSCAQHDGGCPVGHHRPACLPDLWPHERGGDLFFLLQSPGVSWSEYSCSGDTVTHGCCCRPEPLLQVQSPDPGTSFLFFSILSAWTCVFSITSFLVYCLLLTVFSSFTSVGVW